MRILTPADCTFAISGNQSDQQQACLTCAGLPRHAAGLSLIVSLLVLEAHQVRIGLRAEMSANADDVLVGYIYDLLHLRNKQRRKLKSSHITDHAEMRLHSSLTSLKLDLGMSI